MRILKRLEDERAKWIEIEVEMRSRHNLAILERASRNIQGGPSIEKEPKKDCALENFDDSA